MNAGGSGLPKGVSMPIKIIHKNIAGEKNYYVASMLSGVFWGSLGSVVSHHHDNDHGHCHDHSHGHSDGHSHGQAKRTQIKIKNYIDFNIN